MAALFYVPSGTYKAANPRKEYIYYPLVNTHWKRARYIAMLLESADKKEDIE